jgi:DNA-binding transcriptional regulator YdaS (Cro superfamily)
MSVNFLDSMDVCARLSAACKEAGGQSAWAALHGVSPTYVSSVLHARIEPGKAILQALGLVRVVVYREAVKKDTARD